MWKPALARQTGSLCLPRRSVARLGGKDASLPFLGAALLSIGCGGSPTPQSRAPRLFQPAVPPHRPLPGIAKGLQILQPDTPWGDPEPDERNQPLRILDRRWTPQPMGKLHSAVRLAAGLKMAAESAQLTRLAAAQVSGALTHPAARR